MFRGENGISVDVVFVRRAFAFSRYTFYNNIA